MKLFKKHPQECGMSYLEHLVFAQILAAKSIVAFIVLTIHSVFPFLFLTTGSDLIKSCVKQIDSVRRLSKD